MPSPELISEAYRREQAALHATGTYGTASLQFGRIVSDIIDKTGARTVLDYGCGSMRNLATVLRPAHDVEYEGYDPAVPEFAGRPGPADLVCCIDVLEHIEPELLDNVLDDLQRVGHRWLFLTVHTGPARKVLSDGRNAHLIQKPPIWWLAKLYARWDVRMHQAIPSGFLALCRAKSWQ